MTMTSNPKIFCKSSGADLVGIADLGPFKKGWTVVPQDLLTRYTYAISIAKRLDDKIMNRIVDGPTADYAQHYRDINASLDLVTVLTDMPLMPDKPIKNRCGNVCLNTKMTGDSASL